MAYRTGHFDLLRLLFAACVMVTHAWPLTGRIESDPLQVITHGQTSLSFLAVRGFFAISGYLVMGSLVRSTSMWGYGRKRLRRILPALVVNVVVLALLVGPLVSVLPPASYMRDPGTLLFLENPWRMFLGGSIHGLPGAFPENPVTGAVNGSLWTIPYELFAYSGLLLLFTLRGKTSLLKVTTTLLTAIALVLRLMQDSGHMEVAGTLPYMAWSLRLLIELVPFFLVGAWVRAMGMDPGGSRWRWVPMFVLITAYAVGAGFAVDALAWPALVLGWAHAPARPLNLFNRIGDASYGMYLWGYPVQQGIVMLLGTALWPQFLLAMPIAFVLGIMSWRYVEAPLIRSRPTGPSPPVSR